MAKLLRTRKITGALGCFAAAAGLWTATTEKTRAWQQTNTENLPSRNISGPRQAVVIGAGVAGVSTAYQLARRGWTVTVLEASPSPGSQCSAVAAGGMQRSNPVLNKNSWAEVMKSWISPGEFKFFQIVWSSVLDPLFLRWLSKFTMASLFPTDELKQRQEHQLQFTIFALDRLHNLLSDLELEKEVGLNGSGAIKVLPEGTALPGGGNRLSLEPIARVQKDEAMVLDPSLAVWPKTWSCADQETESWSGNSEKFTLAMAKQCCNLGVNMATETRVKALQGDVRVERIVTDREVLNIGPEVEVVVAAGAWTPLLLSTMGVFCPVYPMKGYSVAIDLPPEGSSSRPVEADLPQRMLVNGKLYVTRLGDQVRTTSVGEFAGWDTSPRKEVDEAFRKTAREHLSLSLQSLFDQTETRCGLRPYSADGIILLGRVSEFNNLSLNVGPGFNGWKISAGAAEVLVAGLEGLDIEQLPDQVGSLLPGERVWRSRGWATLMAKTRERNFCP